VSSAGKQTWLDDWEDDEPTDAEVLQLQFAALSSPIRRYLLDLLEVDDATAGDLAASAVDHWGITRTRASQQLQILARAGLIQASADGSWRYYRREPGSAQQVLDWLRRVELAS
jgi:DNA-binding transcriptional ArsR family regulator